MSPSRRQYLRFGALSTLSALAGCSTEGLTTDKPTKPSTESSTKTSPTQTDHIEVEFHNTTSSEAQPHLTIFEGESMISEKDVRVPAEDIVSVESGIRKVGQYELKVKLANGRENSWQFAIEEYDIRMGSDLIITIKSNELTLMIEE